MFSAFKEVLIVNGELLSGIICKKTIGSSSGSLLHLALRITVFLMVLSCF